MLIKPINQFKIAKNSSYAAFTIVELLIVIVIIGILAAITIVSYTGITARANIATVQADLANASKKINMYYALYGVYPTDMINDGTNEYCPTGPTPDNNYCIKPSSGTFIYNPIGTPITDYDLRADNGPLVYHITKDSQPNNVVTTPITAIAATTGTAQIGQTLTAGAITPAIATVAYQWQAATTSNGTYNNIPNATSSTYVVSPNVMGKYVKVVVTGTGSYGSNQNSNATAQVPTDSANWLTIGSQTWAKANLNVGTRIAGTSDQTNNATTEKYCYSDTESSCTTYGGLYQWSEAMGHTNTEGARGICPAGAHIPSDNDWKILEISLGMTQVEADRIADWRGTDQGTQLKISGTSNLNIPFAGFRGDDALHNFSSSGSYAYLWTSTEVGSLAWTRLLDSGHATVYHNMNGKSPGSPGFSIRCVGN